MKYICIIIFSVIFVSCTNNKNTDLPSWYLNSPINTNESLYGTGQSNKLNDAKINALKNISEKLSVSITSSMKSITTTSDNGKTSSYLKENIKDIVSKTKEINFINYRVNKTSQNSNSFFVLVSVNRDALFNEQKKQFDILDNKISINVQNSKRKDKLEEIYFLSSITNTITDAKNKSMILHSIKNNFDYKYIHTKYENILNDLDLLKKSLKIKINSNKNNMYKEELISFLNQNKYKVVSSNEDVVIDLSNNIRYSTYNSWKIAKITSTISVKSNNKVLSTHIINTVGRSSSSNENAIANGVKSFNKKINDLGIHKILYAK